MDRTTARLPQERIFREYERLEREGVEQKWKVLREMNLPGYFHGCIAESKWGKQRREQQWSLVCNTAPALASKHKELPNSLRKMMSFSALKGGKDVMTAKRTMLPLELQQVVEEMVLSRVELGEEITMSFIKNSILFCCEIWNDCIASIRGMLGNMSLQTLQEQDTSLAQMTHEDLERKFKQQLENAEDILRPINLTETDSALLCLEFIL